MFSHLFVTVSLAIFTVASPTAGGSSEAGNMCCNGKTISASDPGYAAAFRSFGLDASDIGLPLTFDCSPISAISLSGTSCVNQSVDCDRVYSSFLVGINCSPTNIIL
ncbi:hypothetical protein SCHPADRAFT_944667 [Schizopora paradoxa]|uniref:Hydrophobin n=1 Tax=Schizopora paradoxa TaxID=27342 RepID=A0A0H2R8I4_9AGAM|nr:hypothetical protein SCHPADRAFT_944667 [Schizopora paradoxa]